MAGWSPNRIDDPSGRRPGSDWNVAAYETFLDLRLRPALDLLARVPPLGEGDIVDLGCGSGAAAPALRERFSGRRLAGVDASEAMLGTAGPRFDEVIRADIAKWAPETAPALIFSNAALHWLGDHDILIPRLFSALAPGGALAVQMPGQLDQPSHLTMARAAAEIRSDLFADWRPFPGPAPLSGYADLLADAALLDLWETTYLQHLAPDETGHPVRAFVSSTGARPILALLDKAEAARFAARWDEMLEEAYPRGGDGGLWFPFRRVFFVARRASRMLRRPE